MTSADYTKGPSSSEYVAVVDDDEPLRRALARLIGASSYRVKTYSSGEEFLASLAAGLPACLILDMHMTGMTGLDIAHRLAAMAARIPIVFLTARDDSTLEHSCRLAGVAEFLTKPVMREALLDAIEAAMGKHRAETEMQHSLT